MVTVKFFSGTDEVFNAQPMPNKDFYKQFGFVQRVKSYDGYSKWVGSLPGSTTLQPISRLIFRKANPSNHKCDARCQSAKGKNCECSCGGKYHGHLA